MNEYSSIKEITQRIFEDKNDFLNKFDEDIYIEYAPFSFMHTMAGCGENIFFEQMIKQIDESPEYSDSSVSIRFRI